MKKVVLLAAVALSPLSLLAQPWMPASNGRPVNLDSVIKKYKQSNSKLVVEEEKEDRDRGKVEQEGKDYLFERWAWFWRQHLDAQGNMVSPVKTMQEWEKYQAGLKSKSAHQRTTATGIPVNWVFQGPDSSNGGYAGLGRINKVTPHPTDPNTIFVGTAGGGPWKTTDGGHTWAALYNNLPTIGVSDLVVNPQNPNTIYICTGDADGYDDYSMGVVKSTDGGTTWAVTGLAWLPTDYNYARSLIINPQDTSMLVLATNVGVYITHNAGTTWTLSMSGDFNQVIFKPGDTTVIYAARYSGGGDPSSQVLRSTNTGSTWTPVTSFPDAQRIALAVCPASPNVVKALASNGQSGLKGIYGSTNSGATFTPLYENNAACTQNLLGYDLGLPSTDCGGQGWYDLCLAINPTDANKVILGGVNNYYSTDGGLTWQIVTQWYGGIPGVQTVHADKHHLVYNPVDNTLYEGCDGGVYKTTNPAGGTWDDITNGMGITEFYRNAVANGVPWCIGGAQDNGTKMVNGTTSTDLTGGDGMQPRIDYASPSTTWYCSYPSGSIDVTFDGGVTYNSITGSVPTTSTGDWVTPYIIHPQFDNELFLGIDQLFMSSDFGASWIPASPVFNSGYNINNIAMPFTNNNYIYVALDDNKIHMTTNFGTSWTMLPVGYTGNISRIIVDPRNENKLWVTFSGYGTTKVAEYNHTTNVWTQHNGTLPDVPVNCITIDSFSQTKYIGTDVAVFYMDTTMTDWALYNTNLPAVIVNDLNINYTTNEMWAATFGRGMWKTIKHETPNEVSIVPFAGDMISVAPNPNRGAFTITTTNKELMGVNAGLRMISADGRTLWQDHATFNADGTLKVVTKGLPAGVYICEVVNEKMTARCRVIVY